jgi:lipopolysaccharide export system protein LptC
MAGARPSPRMRQTLGQVIRLGLPLGALALMSTIFLASRHVDPNRAAALSNLNLEEITREPRIGQARIATVTPENAALTITARTIRSVADLKTRAPLHLKMDAPEGTLDFATGTGLRFAAAAGEITQAENRVTLDRNVTLTSDSGYDLRMQTLHTNLQGSVFESVGPVSGTGPAGQIAAQTLTVTALAPRDGHPDSGYLLAFAGDVRLLYQPRQ